MDAEKCGGPPPSPGGSAANWPPPMPAWGRTHDHQNRRRHGIRRSRALRLVVLSCLAFIVYAQWRQIGGGSSSVSVGVASPSTPDPTAASRLSAEKLRADAATCVKLREKPRDPVGPGRERNARYVEEGGRPTLIRNATVWVGEPAGGTSAGDARKGVGYGWTSADVYLRHGLIEKVEPGIDAAALPDDVLVYDARGRQLTAGIVDMHSHAGVDSLPELRGNEDTNELSSDVTPYVRSIDGIQPGDHQIQVIKSGGVTTSLVLPGSGNNIGGEAFVVKHAVGRADGRGEVSAHDMLADPDRSWRYMKMACGENAKRVYGKVGEHGPTSRLGESWEFRHAFEQAARLVREQDDWCGRASEVGAENMTSYLPQELRWESLGAVLRGQVHVNTHCYTVPDLEAFVDHTNEFGFAVRAFHHAHQTYLVPEILKRVYGGVYPALALFADNMYYKAEAAIGSEYAGKILYDNGLDPIYVSDNPVLNAQHVLFEAAKAYGYGLPYHAALASVTSTPAWYLGLGERIGKVKPGFDADVVLWDSDPLSVGATPVQVWIDGRAQFDGPVELEKPVGKPIAPNEGLSTVHGVEVKVDDVVFTGITKVLLSGNSHEGVDLAQAGSEKSINMVVTAGKITCLGPCRDELQAAKSSKATKIVELSNAHVTDPFTAFGSLVGLNAIDAEKTTDNGPNPDPENFSRGVDGLALGTQKLQVARRYGVTKAISAPKLNGGFTHHGTSVGFRTGAETALAKGAVWSDDVAVHYTLSLDGKRPSISGAVGSLRKALLTAVGDLASKEADGATAGKTGHADRFSEKAYLAKVVKGEMPLALTVHSADTIAAVLRVKEEVEGALEAASAGKTGDDETEDNSVKKKHKKKKAGIRFVILGGAESHLVAPELAAAGVGVVLAPLQSYCASWEQRRCLTGAPLTNTTAVDVLVGRGVVVAIGLEEDWLVRDVGLLAGVARANSGGRIGEREALDLVGRNVYRMLGLDGRGEGQGGDEFVVWEGSPLEIGGRVRGVNDGVGPVSVFE